MLLFGAGMMGTYYLLTLYMQQVLGFGPARAGVAALPFAIGIVFGAGLSSKLVKKFAPRVVAVSSLLIGAAGMLWLSQLADEMPGVFAVSSGLRVTPIATALTAVRGAPEKRAGVASAVGTWRSGSARPWKSLR